MRGATVSESAREGRFLVASVDLPQDEEVYDGEAYAVALHEEWITHCCAMCFALDKDGHTVECAACERVFYCSEACRDRHEEYGGPGLVPHGLVCTGLHVVGPLERQSTLVKPRLILEHLARRFHDEKQPSSEGAPAASELGCFSS